MANIFSENQYGFEQVYCCIPFSQSKNSNLEFGDKVLMPVSALNELVVCDVPSPWMFQIKAYYNSGRVSHCGVLEFTAEEGCIVVPDWVMENLNIQEGELVEVASVVLPTGNYMKLQPHTTKFIELSNPKAVLENNLSSFSCLSTGDTIMITHNDQKFYINILETKPGPAICLIGTECEADFAAPLDYKEPAKPEKVEEKEIEELPKFRPFVGKGRRLDGEPVKVDSGKIQDDNAASTTSGSGGVKSGKLVFGSKGFKNTPKRIPDDDLRDSLKKEETKGQKFQAFTGNKHVLWRE